MQTWSQVVDPNLTRADLPKLADRLKLPQGWSYRPHVLTEELRVDTTSRAAQVTQDDLTNSYSLVTADPEAAVAKYKLRRPLSACRVRGLSVAAG